VSCPSSNSALATGAASRVSLIDENVLPRGVALLSARSSRGVTALRFASLQWENWIPHGWPSPSESGRRRVRAPGVGRLQTILLEEILAPRAWQQM